MLFKCEEGGCSLKNNDRYGIIYYFASNCRLTNQQLLSPLYNKYNIKNYSFYLIACHQFRNPGSVKLSVVRWILDCFFLFYHSCRYNVHLKSKRASLSTPSHQTVNDITVTEETIGHTTTFSQEQPELQHEATTPASDLTTTTTERDIAIKTGYLPPETGNIPLETGSIPSEMGSTPPETGYIPPETGNIPDKTSPLINDKISFEDHETGSESPDLTANPSTSVLDETLTSKTNTDDGGDEENVVFTTLMPPSNHKDGMVTTAHSPVVTNHMTTLTIPHTTNGDRDKGFIAITPVPKNPPTTDRITTSTSDPDDKPVTESITTTKPANQSIGPSEHLQNTNRTDTPTTTYNNDTIAEVKPYIWQVPWWYDGTVNQQHVTLFAMLLIGVTMALIVGFCIARICIRSWRVKRRTRKGYLYLSRFM